MTINWYPGHMKKTKDLILEHLKLVDMVVELLDARIPISSKNPQIDELVGNKQRVVVLNKFDLADPRILEEWIDYYREKGIKAIPVNSITGEGINRLVHEIKSSAQPIIDRLVERGRKPRPIRVMIVGIPNVGKSSLINKLAGKRSAKTGDKPGVTRGKQWIKIRKDLELFDTPGILWPKIDDEQVGRNLAFVGSIKDEILNIEDLSYYLLAFLQEHYPEQLAKRFDFENLQVETLALMDEIGLKRGCKIRGNEIDYNRVANIILDEYREGRIGKISLERP